MSGLVERAASFFVAPSAERPGRRRTAPAPAPSSRTPCAVVLGAPADAIPLARLLAGELRLRTRASCVLLADWRGTEMPCPEPGGVAPPAARRVAERLAARGIDATARGRTVRLSLPPEPAPAASTLMRAAAAVDVPAVCALVGPRPAALDPLLDEQDLIVVAPPAGAGEALAELALAGLDRVRAPVVVGGPVPRGAARLIAASSVATSRALGAAVTDAVRRLA